mgnify:CR=1 FL=1
MRSLKLPQPSPYRTPTLIIVLVLLALSLFALDQAGLLGSIRKQATSVLNPVLGVIHRIGLLTTNVPNPANSSALEAELAQLREEVSRLKTENIEVEQLKLELTRLRQQASIEEEQPWKLLGTDISAFSPDAGRRVALIGIGSEGGVKPGMAVIAKEGANPAALIGVVEDVGPRSANVLLITDFSSVVSAQIYRSDHIISGVIQGQWQRGSRILLEEIPRDELLEVGDVVVTAGLSAHLKLNLPHASIPANIPIGTLENISSSSHSQQATIQPFVDSDRVRYAWVIISAND